MSARLMERIGSDDYQQLYEFVKDIFPAGVNDPGPWRRPFDLIREKTITDEGVELLERVNPAQFNVIFPDLTKDKRDMLIQAIQKEIEARIAGQKSIP